MDTYIECRAWYIPAKRMIPWQEIWAIKNNLGTAMPLMYDILADQSIRKADNERKYDVMLYTGAMDCRGRHLYRVDILRKKGRLYLINWAADTMQWTVFGLVEGAQDQPLCTLLEEEGDTNVIGNGYENAGLLKTLNH